MCLVASPSASARTASDMRDDELIGAVEEVEGDLRDEGEEPARARVEGGVVSSALVKGGE